MRFFKKFGKWFLISLISIILLVYVIFATFLWWNERTAHQKAEVIHKSIFNRLKSPHEIQLIDDGLESLKKRIEVIESATETLELEFFIYELDLASRLITQKLVEKARQGVRVRLLVDFSQPVFKLRPAYAHFLKQFGIEIKYYNTSSLYRILTVQHRSHRKLLIADSTKVLTGGRNIGNDYFNLSPSYNFLDSDILLTGPIVKNIRDSFNLYWNSTFAEIPNNLSDKDNDELIKAMDFLALSKSEKHLFQELKEIIDGNKKVICNDITFVTDFPGVTEKNRMVFKTITEVLKEASKEVVAESPYFVIKHGGLKLLHGLKSRKIKLKILTNSLYSTDAYYTVSALHSVLDELNTTDLNLFVYNGIQPIDLNKSSLIKLPDRWGTHSKRAVIDDKIAMIGTYNIDPRSANLNSELLIICRDNEEFVNQMKKSISKRLNSSWPLLHKGKLTKQNLFKKADSLNTLKFYLALPLSKLFDFLL